MEIEPRYSQLAPYEDNPSSCCPCDPIGLTRSGIVFLILSAGTSAIGASSANEELCGNTWGKGAAIQVTPLVINFAVTSALAFIKCRKNGCAGSEVEAKALRCSVNAALTMFSLSFAINLVTLIALRVNCK